MSSAYYLTGAGLNPFLYAYGQYGNYWGAYYGVLNPYASFKLTESSPPQSFTEPLSLREVRSYLRLPARIPENTDEDNEMSQMISAAREQAEIFQGRDLVVKQWDFSFDYWLGYRLGMRAPLVSVDQFQLTDCDGVVNPLEQGKDYIIDSMKEPPIVTAPYNQTWPTFTPWPTSAILLRFTSGYPTDHVFWSGAGARVKMGMKQLISGWFNNRFPFEKGMDAACEYPYAVTSCLSYGAMVRAR